MQLNNFMAAVWPFCLALGPYAPLMAMVIIGVIVLSISRLGLVVWKWERVKNTGALSQILIQGLRVDSIQLGLMCLIPVLLIPLAAFDWSWVIWQQLSYYWVMLATVLLVFLELATPGFITEYDVRPNRLFVEYLKYPNEVFSMLWRGFRIHVFTGIGFTALACWLMSIYMAPWQATEKSWGFIAVLLSWPIVFVVLALIVRSSTGHRPANPAKFAITTDSMVNSLILNSSWSVIHAVYSLKHENKSSEMYGKMPKDKVIEIALKEHLNELKNNELYPTARHVKATKKTKKPLNLVIVLEESLGATFVESLGGVPVTPELEKLKHDGIWFKNLFATGTRSVRGIEAVVSGFPPTPAQSVVKLSLAQRDFFTIAKLLSNEGYHTEFLYGGESHFDNMNGFFMGNGFQSVVDQKDFKEPVFVGSWGVSDEDLFNQAHLQHLKHHQSGKPFFSLIFSSSNHAPFEFPDGRIELHDEKKATEQNAVKYADYAMGDFFKKAKASPYWEDTVFLIVADHDIRVRGETLVPIKNFHIPALILGGQIEPEVVNTVASQIDLPVTLLSLMGLNAEHPMIGRDLSRSSAKDLGRSMMQFEQNYAWMEGNEVVILRPQKPAVYGLYEPKTKTFTESNHFSDERKEALYETALANVLLPAMLYREKQYDLPKNG
jgi:phosphoglycerol transferase MdoB-like AlkP superfamily enzyme